MGERRVSARLKRHEGWQRGVLWLAGLLCLTPLCGFAMQTTTVAGPVYRADGLLAQGTLLVSWPGFTAADGSTVVAGTTTVTIGADGRVSLALAPNAGADPQGSYYTAVYHLNDGTVEKEYWVVPEAASVTIAEVRVKVVPAAVAQQSVSRQYVDSSISSIRTAYLPLQGGALTGALALSGDPTNAMQAATKEYVDAHAGSSLTLPQAQNVIAGKGDGSAAAVPEKGVSVSGGNAAVAWDEDLRAGRYDARNPKYAGGIYGPNPTAAFQAVEDQMNCDMAMGLVNQANLILPPQNFNIGNVILAPGSYLAGVIDGNGSKTTLIHVWSHGTMLFMGDSRTTTCSDGQQHTNNGIHARVEHLDLHGCGEGGCSNAPGDTGSYPAGYDWTDTGLDIQTYQGDVEWVEADHFGGTGVRVGGVDSQAHHLYTQLDNEWYLFGRSAGGTDLYNPATDSYHGDIEVGGVDGQYDYIETYGTFYTPSNEYGHLGGILTGGGYSSFSHLWPQLNEIGILQPYGFGANNRFYDFRVDFSMGEGIAVADGNLLFFGGLVDGSCQASTVAAALGGRCNQIDASGQGASFLGTQTAGNSGFGSYFGTADWNTTYGTQIIGQTPGATFQHSTQDNALDPTLTRSFSGQSYSVTGPTPDVSVYNHIVPSDTSAITYTSLANVFPSEEVWIYGGNANVTLEDVSNGGYFQTCTGQNLVLSASQWNIFRVSQPQIYDTPATVSQVCAPAKTAVSTGASVPQSCSGAALFYTSDSRGPYGCGSDGQYHALTAPAPPTVYVQTVFNEAAAGVSIAGTTPATCTNGCTGTWQLADGSQWSYAAGGVTTSVSGNDPLAPAYIDAGHADSTMRLKVNLASGYLALTLRYTDPLNSIFVNLNSGNQVAIYDYTAGALTEIASGTADLANLTVTVTGTTVTVTSDSGMAAITGSLPASSTNLTSTKLGFSLENGGPATIASLSVTNPIQ